MTRQAIAYLLIVLMIAGLIAAAARARYYSRDNVLKRQRARDRARRERTPERLEPGA